DDLALLNKDTQAINKTLTDVSSGTSVQATLDHRLLTEEGRDQIKEDFLKTGMVVDVISEIATNSTEDVSDFFTNVTKELGTYEGVKKKIASDERLRAFLQDSTISDKVKETVLDKISDSVMVELGYEKYKNKVIDTDEVGRDDKQIKGHYSIENNTAYNNLRYNTNNKEVVKTGAVEMHRAIDVQEGSTFNQSDEYRDERSKASQNYGENVVKYVEFAMQSNGVEGGISTNQNTTSPILTSEDSVFNHSNIVNKNNAEFASLGKEKGDNWGLSGAAIGGGLELAGQVVPKLAKQYYENGKDWTKINYWEIVKNVDLVDVGMMAGIGAVTPVELSALNSGKKVKSSWDKYKKYDNLFDKTNKNINKKARFGNKAGENKGSIIKEVGIQTGIAGSKIILKSINEEEKVDE
ncbi:MAG: hypothetical protein GY932_05870, partial [Arcobacter sp.]|nr:hypothetical protein [Arcobacter sp.]